MKKADLKKLIREEFMSHMGMINLAPLDEVAEEDEPEIDDSVGAPIDKIIDKMLTKMASTTGKTEKEMAGNIITSLERYT